jgi:hypothetical protein
MGMLTNEVVVLYAIGEFLEGSGFIVAILFVDEQLNKAESRISEINIGKQFFILNKN